MNFYKFSAYKKKKKGIKFKKTTAGIDDGFNATSEKTDGRN